jgi:hypothetical protein
MQHYLVAMNTSDGVKMLNMTRYLTQHATAGTLYGHIWDVKRGDSWSFLRNILLDNVVGDFKTYGGMIDANDVCADLVSFGRALVPGFSLSREFRFWLAAHWISKRDSLWFSCSGSRWFQIRESR